MKRLLLVLCMALSSAVHAGDLLTDAIAQAYAPYRAALFRTNGQNQTEAEQALTEARRAWQVMRERFTSVAPAPYDRDERLNATLTEIGELYAKADAQVRERRLAQAHETLEGVRDLLGELRRRNGVIAFSDHVNAYHAQMERVLKEGPAQVSSGGGLIELTFEAGVLDHLAGRLASEANAAQRQDAAFVAALEEVRASSSRLRTALRMQDGAAARRALGELKPAFGRFFLRFG